MSEPLDLDQLYQAIEQQIREAIPGLFDVAVMPDKLGRMALPAVIVELNELEPGTDPLTGETALEARFEARVMVGAEQPQSQRQALFIASQLAVLLRMQTWGQPVEAARFVRSGQDWTRPELDGYTIWTVEWTQGFYLGQEEWPWPNQPPGNLVFGFSPDIGPDHQGGYLGPEEMA
ncbi:hypothetical protein [Pseudomonas sessilinigenes]|uniref:Phage protein n=1 Tax=Pseudomonas sessilinigenes TaxID=658629 RepID=A0ABX8MTF2_9PSED|nr:hypothetical protein [Pseudomonas sessilinigenes]AZC23227.1 hypothetical protein C4K39_1536 [Pseudomonas sessilinigenes]QXH42242.1 hypothetical protein KSS89_08485 [Pseudomonas sessilinigenes]